jgi:hypothetical protein
MSAAPVSRGLHLAADSIESKFVVTERTQGAALRALDIDLEAVTPCQVYFFDTPDLSLWARGVVLCAHLWPGDATDAAVTLRPLVAPRATGYTATLERVLQREQVEASLRADQPLHELFSKQQRALLRDGGLGNVDWPSLRVLGPVAVYKVETAVRPAGLPLVAEQWRYPDHSAVLEISTSIKCRVPRDERRRVWEFLIDLGLDISPKQQSKTERTLQFFVAAIS